VGYTYDSSGRLWKVTDPEGGITEYTYDAAHRMLTLKDARGTVYLTNQYDTSDRVVHRRWPTAAHIYSHTLSMVRAGR
jgi:YD repeat-containing protein